MGEVNECIKRELPQILCDFNGLLLARKYL